MAGSTMASKTTAVCNKYANEVINKDISIKLIKWQRTHVYGYKMVGSTAAVPVRRPAALIAGVQHLSGPGMCKPIKKKTFLRAPLK